MGTSGATLRGFFCALCEVLGELRLDYETDRLTIVVNHPLDTVPENHDVEVDQ